ncbi:PolC-type DNA polymerase III [Tepidibacillus fermentans]|uniref:DNA polymerase III PolC-type n=1 Tax=Tepidibacillus fermentans TaxID=1281767 RepID=A0A4R3KHR1_9BACI|nr:PolC-type DNA polymerase III [Tepidibacillus fermentans]TCS82979.1 DNA polymerase-3 subunit alpha (Gram-positive type) [Tepidibacillus fermentans]
MGNPVDKNERFLALLTYAKIPKEIIQEYFTEGTIERVEISRKNKEWTFYFEFPKIIPSLVFEQMWKSVVESLKHIASVKFFLRFKGFLPEDWMNEYKDMIITPFQTTPSIYNILKQSVWLIDQNNLIIQVSNQAMKEVLEHKQFETQLRDILQYWCEKNIEFQVSCIDQEEVLNKFFEERLEEDMQLAQEAIVAKIEEEQPEILKNEQRIMFGYEIKEEPTSIQNIVEEEKSIVIQGTVFSTELRELKSGRLLLMFSITDFTDSIQVKVFLKDSKEKDSLSVNTGQWLKVKGQVQYDPFEKELVLLARDINVIEPVERKDTAEEKRIELHVHTNMSAMDGVNSIKKIVEQASKWGHEAIAITDHGVVQAFPEAYEAGQKYGVKIVYGVEANVVDDGVPVVYREQPRNLLEETYIVFDTETTGLSAMYNTIIEIGAVKVKNGEIIDTFAMFVDPKEPLSPKITEITGITNEMLQGAPLIDEALRKFRDFVGNGILVAHNARFDMGFLHMGYKKIGEEDLTNPVIDTVELARMLYPKMKNYKLNTLCQAFNIDLTNHHRAYHDAEATGKLLWKMIVDLQEKQIKDLIQINQNMGKMDVSRLRPFHVTILVKNEVGLKNLYKLISKSHLEYFYRIPRIPRSELITYREGLIFGTACQNGELFDAMLSKPPDEIEEMAKFYDFIEIQPLSHYQHLIRKGVVQSEKDIKNIHKRFIQLGEKLGIPVCVTGDVHHVHPTEIINRQILAFNQIGGYRYHQQDDLFSAHYLTTNEMFEEFSYLDREIAKKIIIDNPKKVVADVEELKPFPDDLFAPVIEGSEEEIRKMSYETAKNIYGDPLPEIVEKRLERELNSIINHGYSVIYLIAHKLVNKSLEDGYLVGSRGSVGSSLVATMTRITEVNPLPPHYVCPTCKHSEFILDGSYGSGFDLPDKNCPRCQSIMRKDGHDIPFETFMGFKGDKVPDIDLNFSGEYQPRVHKYTEELFGSDYVFRAGTISTVADKTAYGYVKKFIEEKQMNVRNAEVERLVSGCTGVKRTTGQHPGGLMVIPQYKDVYDFTPIQRPADDPNSDTITTHFDYHAISGRLLKLDILGHDDPTVIRMLQDLTGIDPKSIPVDDPNVYSIFSGTEALGVTPEQIGTNLGSLGIPEFGTKFVRQMLEDTKPKTFAELVRISGLSHGTDVWLNNAQDIIREKKAVLSEVISTRDDIMVYLIQKGLDSSLAFKIMEKVRKGKGLQLEDIEEMKKYNVPDWYIESCQKIKYMFPKAHAVAYVLMAIRIAYFKVYYPIYYYATYFSVRADEFDVKLAVAGSKAIRDKINEINEKGVQATPKEKGLLTVLELALEMIERGFQFKNVDLLHSDATKFIVDEDQKSLIPPFSAIPGVGTSVAQHIVEARNEGEFLSIEDFQLRAKASKTVVELFEEYGLLSGLPNTNQLSLF